MRGPHSRIPEAFYRGVWGILVSWFNVPDEPPELPRRANETIEQFRPAPGWLKKRKLQFWIALVVIDALLTVLWLLTLFISPWLTLALFPIYLIIAFVPDLLAYVAIHLRYDTTWYVLTDRSMRLRRGIWIIQEATITYENVQNVKISQGPLQRLFGISDLLVQTAGGGGGGGDPTEGLLHMGRIEGVADPHRIRDLIMTQVRQSRSAGIGDDPEREGVPRSREWSWTPAHIALLREIRDELASRPATQ